MKVLFSALAARRGGGLTYVRNIARTFPQGPGDRLSILSPDPIEGLPDRPNIEWIRAPRWTRRPIPRFLLGFLYFRFAWPRRRDFDVAYYAGGTFDVPMPKNVARIVSFCNMLPFDMVARRRYGPGWMRFRHWLLRFVQGRAMSRADFTIFISEHGRDVIDRTLGAAGADRRSFRTESMARSRRSIRKRPAGCRSASSSICPRSTPTRRRWSWSRPGRCFAGAGRWRRSWSWLGRNMRPTPGASARRSGATGSRSR